MIPTQKHRIFFKPEGLDRVYDTAVTFSESTVANIAYQMSVRHIDTPDYNRYLLELKRTDISVNGRKTNEKLVTDLAQKCGSVFYPLQILVNSVGKILSVRNYEAIVRRWDELMDGLSRYYVGESAEAYIAHTNKIIKDRELFKKSLSTDWFLHLYFAPLSLAYNNSSSSLLISYPVLPFKQLIVYEVNQNPAESGSTETLIVRQTGCIVEEQPILNMYNEENQTSEQPGGSVSAGNMEVVYTLDHQTCFIDSAEGTWEVDAKETTRKINIKIVCTGEKSPQEQSKRMNYV